MVTVSRPPFKEMMIGLVVAIASIIALLLWRRGATPERLAPPAASKSAPAEDNVAAPARPALDAGRARRYDPAKRQALLDQLAAVRARRELPGGTTSTTPAPGLPEPELDRAYVQARVRELIPLLVECYEEALARDPALAGTLTVEFTIGGEPVVGGLVEDSRVLEEASTLRDPQMSECVQETMYAAQFVAPASGGQIVVRYPFKFEP